MSGLNQIRGSRFRHRERGDEFVRASWNSSRCDFLFFDRSSADRRDLFLEIGSETLATHHRAAFLLFAALAQHARRSGRVRGREGEPPW